MKVLIACEYSGIVRDAFSGKGHDACSCDLLPTESPGTHYQCDVRILMPFYTQHTVKFNFVGAHPDCTYMTNSGVRWLFNKDGSKNYDRWVKMEEAVNFFNLLKYNIKTGYLENPIPHKYARDGFYSVKTGNWVPGIGVYDQIIQPYQFGHKEMKATCLWLVWLPKLKATSNVYKEMMKLPERERAKVHYASPGRDRGKIRSRFFEGIAQAMADQWSDI